MNGWHLHFVILIALTITFLHCGSGEIIENKGTHFVVAFQSQIRGSFSGNNRIFISAEVQARVRIQVPSLKQGPGQVFDHTVDVPRGRTSVLLPGHVRMGAGTNKANKGINITSDKPIVVHGMNLYGNSSDAFLALPVQVTRPNSKYIVSTFEAKVAAIILVVAAEANTQITFTIRNLRDSFIQYDGQMYNNGDKLTVTLNALECFQIMAIGGDLTGTEVTSSEPISVFSGNDCASVPKTNVLCDHLVEQMPPVYLWGTKYITTPTINSDAKDIYHVVASKDNTQVMVNAVLKSILNAGDKYIYIPSGSTDLISSPNPILVVKYAKSQVVDSTFFDPFMTIIPAVNQFSSEYLTLVPGEKDRTFVGYVNLVIKTEHKDGIRIIGFKKPQTFNWVQMRGFPFSWCSVKLSGNSVAGAVYYIYHVSPAVRFGAFMYGTVKTGFRESYGFLGGIRVDRPESPCTKPTMTPADGLDNDCDNRIDEEIFNGIDDDGDGSIDEDLATEKPTVIVPPDFTFKGCAKNVTTSHAGVIKGHANGKCAYRGGVSFSYGDTAVATQCYIRIARKWTVRDACGNVVNKTQHVAIKFPAPDIEYPKSVTVTCRASKHLTPEVTGKVRVWRNLCSGRVTQTYKDTQTESCYRSPSTLTRKWRVEEACGRVNSHVQRINLLPVVVPRRLKTQNYNITGRLIKDSSTVEQKMNEVFLDASSPFTKEFVGIQVFTTRTRLPYEFLLKLDLTMKTTIQKIRSFLISKDVGVDPSTLVVEDFDECHYPEYHKCDVHAVCRNTVGSYTCQCVGDYRGNGTVCEIGPTITYHLQQVESAVNKNITLPCVAEGIPQPTYGWTLPNGTTINASTPVYEFEVGAADDDLSVNRRVKKVLPDGSLLVSKARVGDSGEYTCIAKNHLGVDKRSTKFIVRKDVVEVDVTVKLEEEVFNEDLNNKSSLRYKTLEREVTVELTNIFKNITGFQRVEIRQFINGSVDVLFRVVVKVDDPKAKPPQLVAKKVGETLRVKVKSGYMGKIKVSPVVKLREKPPAPKEVKARDIQHNQVSVLWAPPELHQMYQVQDYSLQYKEFGSPKWHTFVKTQVLNYRLTNLKSGTGYAVRVKAHNQYDVSNPSDTVELTTLKDKSMGDWMVLILVPSLVVLVLALLGYLVYRKWRKKNRKGRYDEPVRMNELLQQQMNEEQERQDGSVRGRESLKRLLTGSQGSGSGSFVRYSTPPGNMSTTQMMLAARAPDAPSLWREIPRNEIHLGRVLGEGEYGMVIKANLKENGNTMPVAVKKLKRSATESDFKDLLNELELLASVGSHPNIINLIGACTLHGPLLVVVEFAEFGNLLSYLRENRKQNYENMNEYKLLLSVADRLKIAGEVARGMSHLAMMKCVHRDLAARNVLLGDNYIAKVSDFGLSRDVYTNSVYQKTTAGKLPAKWMSIEAIESGLYSSQSDVWSFGVLLWEIETGAHTPYPGLAVPDLLRQLKIGMRLERPFNCEEKLYQMMRRCWCPDPKGRPTFDELCIELKSMYSEATEYLAPSDIGLLPSYQNVPQA